MEAPAASGVVPQTVVTVAEALPAENVLVSVNSQPPTDEPLTAVICHCAAALFHLM